MITRLVERLLGTVTSNDGDLAKCVLSEDEIYMEDMQIWREGCGLSDRARDRRSGGWYSSGASAQLACPNLF